MPRLNELVSARSCRGEAVNKFKSLITSVLRGGFIDLVNLPKRAKTAPYHILKVSVVFYEIFTL